MDIYADVENAIQCGVSRKAILEALHQDGFTMSLKMFDKALYRIRSKNKLSGNPAQAKQGALLKTSPAMANPAQRQFKHNPTPTPGLLD